MRSAPRLIMAATQICLACFASLQDNLLNGKAYYYRAKVYQKLSKPELAEADSAKAKFLEVVISKYEE